jgi:hypothetical protein
MRLDGSKCSAVEFVISGLLSALRSVTNLTKPRHWVDVANRPTLDALLSSGDKTVPRRATLFVRTAGGVRRCRR